MSVLLASAAVALGATVQGAVGIGLALVAAPLLVLIEPALVPGPLLLAALLMVLLTAYRDRAAIDFSGLRWSLIGRLPGTALGALTVSAISPGQMAPVVAAVVLLAVALSASGLRVRLGPWSLIGAGTLSGFMGTVSAIGGPPMALIYQHESGPRLRGTLASFFVVGASISLIALLLVGRLGREELLWAAALLPGVLVGFALSARFARWVDRGYTRPAVLATSATGALFLLLRQLF